MIEKTANGFRKTQKQKVGACISNHEVLKVKRKNGGEFIVLAESGWRAIEETLYLNRVPVLV